MTAAPSAQGSASGRIRRALACVRPFLPRTLLVRTFALLGLLLALAQMGWLAPSLAVHAFGVGVMGGLIIGMVTRTARGHTGRMLQVGRAEVCAYVCVLLAAVVRVLLPALWPAAYVRALDVAALLWALGFALYLWVYTPWLLRTRLDGKDG